MKRSKFVLGVLCATSVGVGPAGAAGRANDSVVEVVTFKLKPGITLAEFAPIEKRVATQYVSKRPGFVSRERAVGSDGEMLVIVHWRSSKDAEASMASFEKAPAAAEFMSKIDASTMSMKLYQQ